MAENIEKYDFDGCLDGETGEKRQTVYFQIHSFSTNAETGEPEITEKKIVKRKTFQIPVEYLRQSEESTWNGRKGKSRRKPLITYQKKQSPDKTKLNVVSTRHNVGPIVLILPTFLICPGWASVLCLLGEACMHIWSHKRNRRKKNSNVEYRSPFHMLSSQFCAHCQSQKWMEKISEIQDKRTLRRKITYHNFLRRVVK